MLTPLVDHMLSANSAYARFLATQPSPSAARTELNALVDRLVPSVSADATGTATIVKATCAALAGSAAMLID